MTDDPKGMMSRRPPEPSEFRQTMAAIYLLSAKLDNYQSKLMSTLAQLSKQETLIMATLDDITAAVAAETTVEAGVITLLGQLSAELQAAIASNSPAALQAVVDSINANSAALSAAVTANTPVVTPPPATP
jgi:hypothetical protein